MAARMNGPSRSGRRSPVAARAFVCDPVA